MKIKKAIFLKRLNRFTVQCYSGNRKLNAYLPNPGRLWELLIPGRILYLKKNRGNFNFKVFATLRENELICLDTHHTNNVVKEILKEGFIKDLKSYKLKEEEIRIGNKRIDFLLEKGGDLFPLEVKSCTLYNDGIAMFPDAVTERGRNHVELIAKYKGIIIFVVYFSKAEYFLPDFHTDPLFSRTLSEYRNSILIKPISIKLDEGGSFKFIKELKIPWHVYDREGKDKGSYIIYGELKEDITIRIGELGRKFFEKGYYLYVGSAMNSLSKRVKRHLKKNKNVKWHIDYLISYFENIKPIEIRSSEKIECAISKELGSIYENVEKFGSSDCKCKSHLYFSFKNPFEDERFIEILLKYRISRLKNFI
ncbi:MAG: DNA/RNA nuclease SfsA [Candidatus Hydrothermales bacterium]